MICNSMIFMPRKRKIPPIIQYFILGVSKTWPCGNIPMFRVVKESCVQGNMNGYFDDIIRIISMLSHVFILQVEEWASPGLHNCHSWWSIDLGSHLVYCPCSRWEHAHLWVGMLESLRALLLSTCFGTSGWQGNHNKLNLLLSILWTLTTLVDFYFT